MNNIAVLNEQFFDNTVEIGNKYSQLKPHYDHKHKISWCMMSSAPRPCFTPTLLADLNNYVREVKREMAETNGQKYDYLVLASDIDGVFNLGGDLDLFSTAIKEGDREGLLAYATACIDVLYQNIVHMESDLTTISLVQGDALGGGFETALSSNILIAERGSKMGLPEVLFNLFPGMGAYSLLSRKVGSSLAEKIILSGKLYNAEELYEMGIVDILAEQGEAELALYRYIKAAKRAKNSYQALRKVKDIFNPISYGELMDVVKVWVEAAFNLTDKDLRMIDRLILRQNIKVTK